MTNKQEQRPWFEMRIEDTDGLGVEASKLAKLLQDLSSAFYAIARAKLGTEAGRPGRRSAGEDSLAAIRIVRVSPGSTIIEADPPAAGLQAPFIDFLDQPTAEDVLCDFALEAQRVDRRQRSAFSNRPEVRRRVQAALRDASEIGRTTEVIVRPRGPRRPTIGEEFRVRMEAPPVMEAAEVSELKPRTHRMTGRAFMVDVEPGRERVRLKLPDGRDLTLDAEPELSERLKAAVGQAVEIEAVELLEGDQVASRTAVTLRLLPSSGNGSDIPPKSVEALAREQGLTGDVPDYAALARAVWTSEDEIAAFNEYRKQARLAASI